MQQNYQRLEPTTKNKQYDLVLQRVGGFGKFQYLTVLYMICAIDFGFVYL